MVPELEKPRITEIQVRMDCNGCVQKIKKALHGINGIYDLYIDFQQQKLTVIGWADPEKIIKAIRKTRKMATICSHAQPSDQLPSEQPQEAPEGSAPPPASEEANLPPAEALPAEAAAPPADPPQLEEKPTPLPVATEKNANQPQQSQSPRPKDVGEVHVIYHHPPDYGYRYEYGQWNRVPTGHGIPSEPQQQTYMTHSYNTYRPSPYVTEYEYIHSPPQHMIYSTRTDHYNEDYHENTRNGNIMSIFSDENPNACSIM